MTHKGPICQVRLSLHLVFGRPCFLVQSLEVHSVTLMVQRLSDSRAMLPAHLCLAFLIALMISLTPVSWRIQVFRLRSRRVMSSIMGSILHAVRPQAYPSKCCSVPMSRIHTSLLLECISSCIFLCIFMLALLLFMMLSSLPMAAQPSAILFLIEAGHHDLSSPSFLGIRKSTSLMVSPSTRCILRPASLLVLWKSVSILVSHTQIKFF